MLRKYKYEGGCSNRNLLGLNVFVLNDSSFHLLKWI